MSWDLGTIKIKVKVEDGQVQVGIIATHDMLEQLFPIDETKRFSMKKKDYYKYEHEQLLKREQWVKDNIPDGSYSYLVRVTDKDFVMEDFKFNGNS